MTRRFIRQLIVVEGRHDTANLQKYFDCDTAETGGTSLDEDVMERIAFAAKTRGVIIFTDPDSPGNRIRNAVNRRIPGCGNAFIEKEKARTDRKVGVEHAGREALEEALAHIAVYDPSPETTITAAEMMELGLSGRPDSAARRKIIGEAFHIGFGNTRTMCRRLNWLGITAQQLQEVLDGKTMDLRPVADEGNTGDL